MIGPKPVGLVVIGDEILVGRRTDRHFEHVRAALDPQGFALAWCRYEPDDRGRLVVAFRQVAEEGVPVICIGGIGATPDDQTRQAAAEAFDRPLNRHPQVVELLEERFGARAYPRRVMMAELPGGCELIPNGFNGIPGFSVGNFHFLPGFPEMAWPMLSWLFAHRLEGGGEAYRERSVWVRGVPESDLIEVMESITEREPLARPFSLPRLGAQQLVELGVRAPGSRVDAIFAWLERELDDRGLDFGPHKDF